MRSLLPALLLGLSCLFALPAQAQSTEAAADKPLPGVIRMPRYAPATPQQLEANACNRRCADPLLRCTRQCKSESCRTACLNTHQSCEAQCPSAPTPAVPAARPAPAPEADAEKP